MNKLENKFTDGFYKARDSEDLAGVHKYYVKLRAYVIENEHDETNFEGVTKDYINYVTSSNLKITLNLEDEKSEI